MRFAGNRSVAQWAVLAAMMVLLPALAVLQYRWIGDVSRAERERMQAHLRLALARIRQEFDGELASAYTAFQAPRPPFPPAGPEQYADRFMRWRSAAPYPALVRDFYFTQGGESGVAEIFRLDRERERFERIEWPAHLAALRARLEMRARAGVPPGLTPPEGAAESDIPAMVAPRLARGREMVPWAGPMILGWTIAELDLTFLAQQLLPELVKHHFGPADYQVLVVEREDPAKAVFQSAPHLSAEFAQSADGRIGLLYVVPELGQGMRRPRPLGPGPGAIMREPAGPGAGGRPFGPPGERGRWLLYARHSAGSLEAAVSRTRVRNLAVSFAGLLLMGGALLMLAVSTRRAHRLAELQMEFIAGVSHELRTPLAVICSAADNLADGLVANADQARRYGAVVRKEGRRLTEMVEQVLGFARAQSGRMTCEFEPVEVTEVIERALADVEGEVRASGCAIEKHLETELPPVMADPRLLAQSVRNLVGNAAKYGAEGKWIGVRAGIANGGSEVRISVEDRGPGVNPQDLPHIFEPFYRGGEARSAQVRGAGLGLSMVKRIAEAHGGKVWVARGNGGGACFTIAIPVMKAPS